jgi:hypothetical protein
MKIGHLLTTIILGVAMVTGCSKKAEQQSGAPRSVDLGVVELTPDTPSRQDLGGGATCEITASSLGPGMLQIIAVLEEGGTKGRPARVAPVAPDQPLHIGMGTVTVQFTPHLK